MKTEESVDEQITTSRAGRSKRKSWLAGVGAILVVAIVVGASAIVFAQLGQHHKNPTTIPPAGSWVQVLKGYTLLSLVPSNSNPPVLYACAAHSQLNIAQPGQSANQSGTSYTTPYTVLRSTDFGGHWQDIGSKADLGISCQLAVNPDNSNELYAIGIAGNAQATGVLKHSTDGGQTWTTIQPALKVPGTQSAPAWNVEQLSIIGNALFGVQWLPQKTNPALHSGVLPKYYARLTRLVKSVDGGHTWTVLDQQFTASWQEVDSYVVDPSNSGTVYELVSLSSLPIQSKGTEPDLTPPYGTSADLYKTANNGASWQLLLKNLPFGSQLHLAKNNSHMVYVGGTRRPLPYLHEAPVVDNQNMNSSNLFQLQVSRDGGASWSGVPNLTQDTFVQSWFADPNGRVYTYTNGSPGLIQRYDPSSSAWSQVTRPPIAGALLSVTPGDANSDILWFAGVSKGQFTLYRYVS